MFFQFEIGLCFPPHCSSETETGNWNWNSETETLKPKHWNWNTETETVKLKHNLRIYTSYVVHTFFALPCFDPTHMTAVTFLQGMAMYDGSYAMVEADQWLWFQFPMAAWQWLLCYGGSGPMASLNYDDLWFQFPMADRMIARLGALDVKYWMGKRKSK